MSTVGVKFTQMPTDLAAVFADLVVVKRQALQTGVALKRLAYGVAEE